MNEYSLAKVQLNSLHEKSMKGKPRISLTSRVWRCNHELNELTYGKHNNQ